MEEASVSVVYLEGQRRRAVHFKNQSQIFTPDRLGWYLQNKDGIDAVPVLDEHGQQIRRAVQRRLTLPAWKPMGKDNLDLYWNGRTKTLPPHQTFFYARHPERR